MLARMGSSRGGMKPRTPKRRPVSAERKKAVSPYPRVGMEARWRASRRPGSWPAAITQAS